MKIDFQYEIGDTIYLGIAKNNEILSESYKITKLEVLAEKTIVYYSTEDNAIGSTDIENVGTFYFSTADEAIKAAQDRIDADIESVEE